MEKTRINLNKNRSLLTLWGVILVITYFRILTLVPDHISWDVFGYYIYLPSVFYHSDFYLDDLSWVQDLMLKYNISDTLYQVIDGPQNKPVALFLYGMSILYAPFFGIGHLAAGVLGHPLDGLSLPYQYSLALGFNLYIHRPLVRQKSGTTLIY